MPACYGDMALLAVQCFLTQTYEGELELIVLDNNVEGDTIQDLLPEDDRIHYYRVDKMPVGALRNLGTSYATGDIICTWDCDDWYHPERVSQQVARMQETGKQVTGFHSIYYYDMSNGQTYKYHYEPNRPHPPYACGSSQCYTKAWWMDHKFPATGIEDYLFQLEALNSNELDSIDGAELLVARAHGDSVCAHDQYGRHRQFPPVPHDELPAEFYAAIAPKAVAKPKSKSKTGA